MSSYRRYGIITQTTTPYFYSETTSILPPKPSFSLLNPFLNPPPFLPLEDDLTLSTLDLLNPNPNPNSALSLLDFPAPFGSSSVTDLIQIETTPFCSSSKRLVRVNSSELYLQALCDRVSSLESKFDRLLERKVKLSEVDRKYTWTAEIKGKEVGERKYKWIAEIDGDKKGKRGERKYQWSTELKGKDDDAKRTYTWKATIGGEKDEKKEKKEKKKKKDGSSSGGTRIVEIEEPCDQRIVALRQV